MRPAMLALAFALLASAGPATSTPPARAGASVAAGVSGAHASRLLVRRQNRALHPVAASTGYLVWGSGGIESESLSTQLVQRRLYTGATGSLEPAIRPDYGVAATRGWVVYATGDAAPTLFAVRHDGSGRRTIATGLIAPLAARGERIAWAQEDHGVQRVFVRDIASGRQWLAARLPRCLGARCYRIDFVTLADRGVVFSRGAIGPQPSVIVRRAFADAQTSSVAIPNDPQPDLAPSSAGALYYAYARGWFRWDFGTSRPRLTRFRGTTEAPVLQFERGDWLLRSGPSCRPSLLVVPAHGATLTIPSPGGKRGLARTPGSDCAELTDVVITAKDVITAWAFRPPYSIASHVDFGLVGAIVATSHRR